jgi:hypothetical protein
MYFKQNGKYLKKKCCCDDCPCQDLNTLPVLCTVTLTTPEGDFVFDVADTDNARASWTSSVIDNVCWLFYDHTLVNNECIGGCEEAGTSDVTSVDNPEGFCCEEAYVFTCEDCELPEGCDGSNLSGYQTKCYKGDIVWGDGHVLSTAQIRVQYKFNCTTEVWYRKISWSYIFNHYVIGYFRGTLTNRYQLDAIGDPDAGTSDCFIDREELIQTYNTGCVDECEWITVEVTPGDPGTTYRWPVDGDATFPECVDAGCECVSPPAGPLPGGQFSFIEVAITPCLDETQNVVCANWPVVGVIDHETWMGQYSPSGGLYYGIILYPYYTEDWTVVASPFIGFTSTSKLATGADPLFHSCSVADNVPTIITDPLKTDFTFSPPSEWSCWEWITGECTEDDASCGVMACSVLGPPGITVEFCEPNNVDPIDDPSWDDHAIAFTTALQSEDCPT